MHLALEHNHHVHHIFNELAPSLIELVICNDPCSAVCHDDGRVVDILVYQALNCLV